MNNGIKRVASILKNKKIISFIKNKLNRKNEEIEDIILSSRQKFKSVKNYKNNKNKSITFLIPEFGIGSGGHTTIFRIASFFEKNGYNINLILTENLSFTDKNYTKYFINEYYIPFNPKIFLNINDYLKELIPENEIFICTSWRTAYILNKIPNIFKNKFYLVQDYEAEFNPISSLYYFAENSYKLPFFKICASKWLSDTIKNKFNSKADFFNLGYDDKFYFPQNLKKDHKSILYYGRWETPRRGFELVMTAFKIVKEKIKDVDIKIYGSNNLNGKVPFNFTNLGQLSQKQLAKEFNKATIGLSVSLTNVSLTPAEMLACKLPLVEINHPSVSNMFENNKEILLAEPNPEDIANKLITLLENKKKRDLLSTNGYNKVISEYSWNKSFEKIKKIIEKNSIL